MIFEGGKMNYTLAHVMIEWELSNNSIIKILIDEWGNKKLVIVSSLIIYEFYFCNNII